MLIPQADIDRLLLGRALVDEYRSKVSGGYKDTATLNCGLQMLGLADYQAFEQFNERVCLHEADRCYRAFLRSDWNLLDEMTPAICDGCQGRGIHCVSPWCFRPEANMAEANSPSLNESQIVASQRAEAAAQGVEPLITARPIDIFHYQEFAGNTPQNCCMVALPVEDPRFDIFWGMEKYGQAGVKVQAWRDQVNNGNN